MTSPSLPQPARAPRPGWRDYLRALGRSHRKARVELSASLPLLQHLEELRRRTFTAVGLVALTTLLSFVFAEQLVDFLTGPIGGRPALVSIEITENMAIFMRVSLLSGVVLGMPGVVYQVLRFVLPGLTGRERRWLLLGVPLVSLLFLSGVAFAWFVMIPVAIPFLVNFMGITTQMRPANYFQFITSLMFWMGVCFEMPAVLMLLSALKLVTARQLAGAWRYALVLMAIVAAAITPTVDPVNMGLVMLPLAGLYLVSLLLAALVQKR
jgi:sec-independent protein translocase protein TatC